MTQRVPVLLAALAGLLAVGTVPTLAGTTVPDVEAWLDHPLPTDAAPGSTVEIGVLLWHPASDSVVAPSVFIRVHPASGADHPVEVPARQDWPGHVVASVRVPSAGLGAVEIGTAGTACTADGCTRSDALYRIAGSGPPPDAPPPTVVAAAIVPPPDRLVAGTPADLGIVLTPRAAWAPAAVRWPVELILQVRRPRGPVLDEAVAGAQNATLGSYHATINVPEAGTLIFQVAAPSPDDPAGVLFGGSAVSLVVDAAPEPMPGPVGGVDPMVAAVVLVAVATATVAGIGLLAVRRSG